MSKVIGLEKQVKEIKKNVVKTLRSKGIENEIKQYLAKLITDKIDAKGKSFPKKKDSTIKAYQRKGYDTEHWLVRTGVSTVVKKSNIKDGVMFEPTDPANILQYVPQSEDWFLLNIKEREKIIDIVRRKFNV